MPCRDVAWRCRAVALESPVNSVCGARSRAWRRRTRRQSPRPAPRLFPGEVFCGSIRRVPWPRIVSLPLPSMASPPVFRATANAGERIALVPRAVGDLFLSSTRIPSRPASNEQRSGLPRPLPGGGDRTRSATRRPRLRTPPCRVRDKPYRGGGGRRADHTGGEPAGARGPRSGGDGASP